REDVVATAGPGEVVGEVGHRSAFYASLGTMTTGTFIVECPCCQAKLTVDPEVRAVIAHEEPPRKRTVADLDTAFGALGAKAAARRAPAPPRDAERGVRRRAGGSGRIGGGPRLRAAPEPRGRARAARARGRGAGAGRAAAGRRSRGAARGAGDDHRRAALRPR